MQISEIAIKRPVFTTMVTVAIMVLGLMGLSRLGTELFPDVDFPVVSVAVSYPGASPGEVETLITKPMEDAVMSINGIDRVKTFSREGQSETVILFKLGVDVKDASTQVRERVARARILLPQSVKEPVVSRMDLAAAPIAIYGLGGGGRSLTETAKYARDVLKPALEQVEGVAEVRVTGAPEREFHVNLDMARIEALRLSPMGVVQKIRAQNLDVPAGHFDEGSREVNVRTVGKLKNVDELRSLIVANAPDGSSVRLSDIALVEDGFEEIRTRTRVNGAAAVTFAVLKQSGKNTVAVNRELAKRVAALEPSFPAGMKSSLIFDASIFILENTHEVEVAIFYGGAMAILVILVFMLDLRATLISAVALPTSVVATFFVMYLLGFTLNMMTLLALSLAIGLLIDDAVVVRENITKHLERGVPPREAALIGTKEIALSVLATTLTVVAVFLPVSFMEGMVGQFFKQFGLTICAAVVMSLFVAFTLDPMLSSRFSRARDPHAREKFLLLKAPVRAALASVDALYKTVLSWGVRHKLAVAGIALASLIGMGQIAGLMGNDYVSAEDRGEFEVDIELPAGTTLDEASRLSQAAENETIKDPDMVTLFSVIGFRGQVNTLHWKALMTNKRHRDVGIDVLKARVRTLASKIPGAKVAVSDPAFVEGADASPIIVLVRAPTYDVLDPSSRKIAEALKQIPGVTDVTIKYSPGRPELRVGIDRDRAAGLGIPASQIAGELRASLEGEEAGKLRQGKDEVPIRVRLHADDRRTVEDVLHTTVWSPTGSMTLRDLVTIERGEGPNVIEREDRERQIAINASPLKRPLGEIAPEMTEAFAKLNLPPGVTVHMDGQIKQMTESNESLGLALMLAVVFIYIVLASQFESLIHPFTIMLTLPLALVGAIVALFLAEKSLAMGLMIGIILLMGLVTKNAILLLDRAIVRVREHGETPMQAILEAGPERLRPILMTSAAMILGMLPTALSSGDGSEFRSPMAVAVIGGVVSSTLLSLIVVPAFYVAIENGKGHVARFGRWVRGRGRATALP